MFERLTRDAIKVIMRAHDEASRIGHAKVDCEHMLLALIAERPASAATFLAEKGMDIDSARIYVLEYSGRGDDIPKSNNPLHGSAAGGFDFKKLLAKLLPDLLTDETKKALERAADIAKESGAPSIDTMHVLYGVLQSSNSTVPAVLKRFGVELPELRNEALAALKSIT